MEMIEEIKKELKMEIRPSSKGIEYLEAVVNRGELEPLLSILKKHLGGPAKEFGKEASFPKPIQKQVDALGGLRTDQSFFYKKDGTKMVFAALWPWESNPEKITLKSGLSVV